MSGGSGAEISRFIQIASGNEKDLQTALAYVGPIAVAVDASSTAFRVGMTHSDPILEECTTPSGAPGRMSTMPCLSLALVLTMEWHTTLSRTGMHTAIV